MNLTTTLLFIAGLAVAGIADAQSLPLTTSSNLFRPDSRAFSRSVPNEPQPAAAAHEVRLTVVTIAKDVDRARQMRLTLGTDPPPALTPPPETLRGQALMTVHVRMATTFAP